MKKVTLNFNTRLIRLNLHDLDLDKIYDAITVGEIEMVRMHNKSKYSEQLSDMNRKKYARKNERQNRGTFRNCISIYFSTWMIRLFKGGDINAICFPDEETYKKDIELVFDVLRKVGYGPIVENQKDILKKDPTIKPHIEDVLNSYLELASKEQTQSF